MGRCIASRPVDAARCACERTLSEGFCVPWAIGLVTNNLGLGFLQQRNELLRNKRPYEISTKHFSKRSRVILRVPLTKFVELVPHLTETKVTEKIDKMSQIDE